MLLADIRFCPQQRVGVEVYHWLSTLSFTDNGKEM